MTPGFADASSYPETWHVFVDWNRDGDFNDANEHYNAGVSETAVNLALQAPANAQTGLTKMRITMDFYGGHWDACRDVRSGEVEDYILLIK